MYDEIIDIYTGKKKLNRGIVEKRKKSDFIVIYSVNKETRIIYGSKATKLFNVAKGESDSEIIKGMVASQGKKKKLLGKVRVVRDPYKAKFKTGEILVASMTRIEFVPLMRKAAGIITNEGGIASHAAVVSREFGLPCIIGTRYATDKLKNGDKIEMDMEEGTIKVIN